MNAHIIHNEMILFIQKAFVENPIVAVCINMAFVFLAFCKPLLTAVIMNMEAVYTAQIISAYTGTCCSLLTLWFVVINPLIKKSKEKKGNDNTKNLN